MLEIRHQALHDGLSIQGAYDALYKERDLLMRDSFYLWLIGLIAPPAGSRLVDVACGHGRLVELAARQGIDAVGIDLSFTGLARGAQQTPQAGWVVADGKQLPLPSASADYVVSIGSLEHYDDPVQGARELARILKPAGWACVLLPNAYGLFGNIRRVWRYGEIFDDRQPLQRYATRRSWETLLARGGLTVERLIPYGEVQRPQTWADLWWMASRPQKIVRAALGLLTPPNLANHFVFICRSAPTSAPAAYYPMLPNV
jgi:SAM-dependent methyltransferase